MNDTRIRDAFRRWGYLQADLDRLGRIEPFEHADLRGIGGEKAERWRRAYCGAIGAEFMHMPETDRCEWVAGRMEEELDREDTGRILRRLEKDLDRGDAGRILGRPKKEPDREDTGRILRRLAEAELFERFVHKRYVGTKRYSLEGLASLIPLLDAVLEGAALSGARIALIGMSHRGRLNVMLHIVGRPARDLFAHFEEPDPRSVLGSGDVRYHLGATGEYRTAGGEVLEIHLVSNPSHLEAVDPVLAGRARARQERVGPDGPTRVLPILIHGDAAFAGQGIAAETLNMDGLAGFGVCGTVHIVANNLIGFTTPPAALHASRFATDVAKRLALPIFHVNGEDPEAAVRAGRIALDYRYRFGTDVVIDLIGFRRYGHSEVDDPTTTQPLLYRLIERKPMLWEEYAGRIGAGKEAREGLEREINGRLEKALEEGRREERMPVLRTLPDYWAPFRGGRYETSLEVETGVARARLSEIAVRITALPDGFTAHPKIKRGLEQRARMGSGEEAVDWGMAEALAFGSLLREGVRVRLSGQDSRRGTFNHRHAVLFDSGTGEEYCPLSHLHAEQAPFSVHDSVLSEAAVLGFEYGFSRDFPEALVCWEAQFGDFANGAQVVIDQFLAAGESKWGLLSGLVLLLPHGYEGQGPEHSTARLERFLQLAAEDNIQVCQPSTAAQYFHLLRRQALRPWRKPLIVLTPKGMLRSQLAASPLESFLSGRFAPVLVHEMNRERLPGARREGRSVAHSNRPEDRSPGSDADGDPSHALDPMGRLASGAASSGNESPSEERNGPSSAGRTDTRPPGIASMEGAVSMEGAAPMESAASIGGAVPREGAAASEGDARSLRSEARGPRPSLHGSEEAERQERAVGEAQRILVCTGKLAHELRAERVRRQDGRTAIVSLEQIYPFPDDELREALARHGDAAEIVWIQEEPANMGALSFVRPHLERLAGGRRVTSIKRSPSASPATGSSAAHQLEQKALLELAFAPLRAG